MAFSPQIALAPPRWMHTNTPLPGARASNHRPDLTAEITIAAKIDLAAALVHLPVSAGRVGSRQEGANLRTAAKFRSLMALFEALEILER